MSGDCTTCFTYVLDTASPALRGALAAQIGVIQGQDFAPFELEINGLNDLLNAKSAQLEEAMNQINFAEGFGDDLDAARLEAGFEVGQCPQIDAAVSLVKQYANLLQAQIKVPFNMSLNALQASSHILQGGVARLNTIQATIGSFDC